MGRVIEIRPVGTRWKSFECAGVEPVFQDKEKAIGYAHTRAGFSELAIEVYDSTGNLTETIMVNETKRQL